MPKISAGILMFRKVDRSIEVLLVHPGGPYFVNKDEGAWTIPKGLVNEDEKLEQAALREFAEETGIVLTGDLIPLGEIKQKGGKVVHAWAVQSDLPEKFFLNSNSFEIEWPPRSGLKKSFPEIDKAEFFNIDTARKKIIPKQVPFLERLEKAIN